MADCNEQSSSGSRWKAFGIAGLGVVQISAGVALELYSAGLLSPLSPVLSYVGLFLIREGSSDIAFAVITGVTGTCSWKEYAEEKIIGLLFSVVSFGAERWLFSHVASGIGLSLGSIVRRSAINASLAAVRGVVNVLLGEFLKKAQNWILKNFHDRFEAATESVFSQAFVNLQEDVGELFRSDPANAERLIWEAFEEVLKRYDKYLRLTDVVKQALILALELSLLYASKKETLSVPGIVIIKFMGLLALSATECFLFAYLLTSLHETLRTLNREEDRQLLAPPAADEDVEEFVARFKQRVKASVVKKVSERLRRGLLQAIMQSFVQEMVSKIRTWAQSIITKIRTCKFTQSFIPGLLSSARSRFLRLWKCITG